MRWHCQRRKKKTIEKGGLQDITHQETFSNDTLLNICMLSYWFEFESERARNFQRNQK